jgi:hypothetical protein
MFRQPTSLLTGLVTIWSRTNSVPLPARPSNRNLANYYRPRRKTIPARANPQIVLSVVETVGNFGHEVFGLYGANQDVSGHLDINAAARRHGKIIFGPC